jgi:hypothetical protein
MKNQLNFWATIACRFARRIGYDGGMEKHKFTLRRLFVFVAIVAFGIASFIYSQKQWARTNRLNANMSYWTMRTNLDHSRATMAPADYQSLRQKIDADWKKLNPDLELPDNPPK